jgi:hypothetical protein
VKAILSNDRAVRYRHEEPTPAVHSLAFIFIEKKSERSRHDPAHQLSMHVREAEIAALVAEGQALVVESEQMQHGGV